MRVARPAQLASKALPRRISKISCTLRVFILPSRTGSSIVCVFQSGVSARLLRRAAPSGSTALSAKWCKTR